MTFEQAARAKAAGFSTEMRYLALRDFAMHLERVKARADAGGHSASEATMLSAHRSSLANLPRAVVEMDDLWVYDNSPVGGPPRLILESRKRRASLSLRRSARLARARDGTILIGPVLSGGGFHRIYLGGTTIH